MQFNSNFFFFYQEFILCRKYDFSSFKNSQRQANLLIQVFSICGETI